MNRFISCACILLVSTIVSSESFSEEEGRNYMIRRILSVKLPNKMQPNATALPHDFKETVKFRDSSNKSLEVVHRKASSTMLQRLVTASTDREVRSSTVESRNISTTSQPTVLPTPLALEVVSQSTSSKTKNELQAALTTNSSSKKAVKELTLNETTFETSSIALTPVITTTEVSRSKTSSGSLQMRSHQNTVASDEQNQIVTEVGVTKQVQNVVNLTTLSSIFDENLIPPLPEQWPYEDENWNSYDEDYYRERGHRPLNSSRKVRVERVSVAEKQHSLESPPRQPPTSSHPLENGQVAEQEIYQTVTAIGKAMIDEPMGSRSIEDISYATMAHDRHWYLWEGFAEQKSVSSNNTGDLTQVYWRGFGFADRSQKGIWIMKVGCAASIFILVAAIASQNIKYRNTEFNHNQKSLFITNLAICFIVGHLFFIFGIQATNIPWACGVVALQLHFLHLLGCSWILALSIRLLRYLLKRKVIYSFLYYIPVWISSAMIVLISFIFNPAGYEMRSFCWLSVEKGMLVSYIAPVCTLLLVNAGVCVACQKQILDSVDNRHFEDRNDLKAGVVILPLEGIAWFLTIVALEDNFSYALDLAAAFSTIGVAFFILHYLALSGWNPDILKDGQFEQPTEDDPSILSLDESTELTLMQQSSALSSPDAIIVDEYQESLNTNEYQESLYPDEQEQEREEEEREVY